MIDERAWQDSIKKYMLSKDWILDRDDESTLGFYFDEPPAKWIRDYDKKTHRFVQFNANKKLNLIREKNDI